MKETYLHQLATQLRSAEIDLENHASSMRTALDKHDYVGLNYTTHLVDETTHQIDALEFKIDILHHKRLADK